MNAITPLSPRTSQSILPQPNATPQLVYDARHLTQGNPCATIILDDQTYVLRITKSGKLILTK